MRRIVSYVTLFTTQKMDKKTSRWVYSSPEMGYKPGRVMLPAVSRVFSWIKTLKCLERGCKPRPAE